MTSSLAAEHPTSAQPEHPMATDDDSRFPGVGCGPPPNERFDESDAVEFSAIGHPRGRIDRPPIPRRRAPGHACCWRRTAERTASSCRTPQGPRIGATHFMSMCTSASPARVATSRSAWQGRHLIPATTTRISSTTSTTEAVQRRTPGLWRRVVSHEWYETILGSRRPFVTPQPPNWCARRAPWSFASSQASCATVRPDRRRPPSRGRRRHGRPRPRRRACRSCGGRGSACPRSCTRGRSRCR